MIKSAIRFARSEFHARRRTPGFRFPVAVRSGVTNLYAFGVRMDLHDPKWASLKGGYRSEYDPRSALEALQRGESASAWDALWNGLHHQGDVGEASYAAVPHIVRIGANKCADDLNLYVMVATIEECRALDDNPPLPDWLEGEYRNALREIERLALSKMPEATGDLVSALFQLIAAVKQQYALAELATYSEAERCDILKKGRD